jgi:rsbT co-antagonist protein RsbR
MTAVETDIITKLVTGKDHEILPEWIGLLKKAGILETGRLNASESTVECRDFLGLLRDAAARGGVDVANPAYTQVRDFLGNLSRSRALQGFSPGETAIFVFSLKEPLFNTLNRDKALSPAVLAQTTWAITLLLDELGPYTSEVYQKSREDGSFVSNARSQSFQRRSSGCGKGYLLFPSSARLTVNARRW